MSRRDEIKELIVEYQRHLHHLQMQQASFGLHTPPYILTQIEDIEIKIKALQLELDKLELEVDPK